MCRACAEPRATGDVRRTVPASLFVSAIFALAGCGSAPERSDVAAPTVVEQPAAQAPSSAQTFPLEGDATAPARMSVSDRSGSPLATTDANAPMSDEPPLPAEAVQQFQSALAMLESGNAAGAEQAFRALSTAYPAYSGPLVNLGILQAKAGKLEDAERTLQQAIARRPDNASAHNQLGIVYRRLGRFADAEQAYLRAVEIDPNYANAHLNLGVLCDLYLQQPQRALEAFERYLSLVESPDEKVSAWVKELKVRLESAQRNAGAG
jgi:Flp pilus assembly protein TadD